MQHLSKIKLPKSSIYFKSKEVKILSTESLANELLEEKSAELLQCSSLLCFYASITKVSAVDR